MPLSRIPALHLVAAACALCCNGAFAQTSDSASTQRVEVTGSNIRRLTTETASPVQIISRTEITATGANTVRQVLDTITATVGNEIRDDGNSTSFAAGASGVSMRGLGKGATLVLMNGHRIANFGLADGAQFTFVNIDAIPADIIDRIEILKDGASAIYGSDAMAGVINIITRSEYQGVGVSASYQTGQSPRIGKQGLAGIVAGMGNLATDRYNVLANLELYKREGYMLSDVLSAYPAWHKAIYSPAFGDPSLTSYPGNLFKGSSRVGAVASCPADQRNAAGSCTTNLNSVNQYSDPAERLNLFSQARVKFSNDIEGVLEAHYSKTKTDYLSLPYGFNAPATAFRWFDGNAKQIRVVNKPLLATTNPVNTLGVPAGIEYRFMDPGISWDAPATASQYALTAGLKGALGTWDWDATLVRNGAKATKDGLAPVATTFIDAIQSGEYKIGGANSPELLSRMFHNAQLNGSNTQTVATAKIRGDLMQLPAGPLSVAFGAEQRTDNVLIKSADEVMRAELIGRGALFVDGSQTLKAVFAEAEAPVVKGLVANAALRYDQANGFGSRVSPKLGLRYEVLPSLLLRGTVGTGFRAPNVAETLAKIGVTGFFNGTYDPRRCDTATAIRDILKTGNVNDKAEATNAYNSGCSASVPAMISSNPQLKPELSRSVTLGFVFEPIKDFSIAVDYFKIERRNEVSYRDPDYVLAREGQGAYSSLIARAPLTGQDLAWAARANELKPGANVSWSDGQLTTLLLQYENFGKTESSGVDVDMKGKIGAGEYGTVKLGLQATYALTNRAFDIDANTYRPNTVGLRNVPRLKAVGTMSWVLPNWTTSLRLTYTSRTELNNDETDVGTWGEAACQARLKPGELPCFRAADTVAQIGLTYTGVKNLSVFGIIGNAWGDTAPINLRDGYTLRPRTFKVGAEYKF